MKKALLLFYNTAITAVLGFIGLSQAQTTNEYVFASLFIPLTLYFFFKLISLRAPRTQPTPTTTPHQYLSTNTAKQPSLSDGTEAIEGEVIADPTIRDIDKRLFLKLIGSGGLSLFIMSLFTKKSHAAFFGSVPGPGTVAIKDSSGTQIDPAEKQPTDGYEISELDESDATYSYYGFVHKDGAWYIARETKASGSYRYTSGASSFSTGWTNKASPTIPYNYFDTIF